MQGVVRKIVSKDRFYQLVNQVKTNGRNWLTLDHGDGWTEDFSEEQEAKLFQLGIKCYEDWPHGGNGHSLDGFIVEMHFVGGKQ
jgi:hypothetical protein